MTWASLTSSNVRTLCMMYDDNEYDDSVEYDDDSDDDEYDVS